MMVWSERRGFWTLARIPFAVTKRRRAAIPEILLSVYVGFFLGQPFLTRSLTSPVSLYLVIKLVIVDLFTPKVKETSCMTQGP